MRLRCFKQGEMNMKNPKYSEEQIATMVRLQQIEEENQRLKQLVADLPFYKYILQEILIKQH
jgi:hypothetical protein